MVYGIYVYLIKPWTTIDEAWYLLSEFLIEEMGCLVVGVIYSWVSTLQGSIFELVYLMIHNTEQTEGKTR